MQIHDCTTEIKQAALKVTPARIATLKLLESHDKPVDAQHIFDHLEKELGIDRVTVFRILKTFVEKGVIRKLELGEGKAWYEAAQEDHHHLICEQCGDIQDISDCNIGELEKDIQKKKNFFVKRHSLEFFGICNTCQAERGNN